MKAATPSENQNRLVLSQQTKTAIAQNNRSHSRSGLEVQTI